MAGTGMECESLASSVGGVAISIPDHRLISASLPASSHSAGFCARLQRTCTHYMRYMDYNSAYPFRKTLACLLPLIAV